MADQLQGRGGVPRDRGPRPGDRRTSGPPSGGRGQAEPSPGVRALRRAVAELLEDSALRRAVSPGFYFQRCLPIWEVGLGGIRKEKSEALKELDRLPGDRRPALIGEPELYRALLARRSTAFQTLRMSNEGVELTLRNIAPFVTGIGQSHPLENGFAFLKPYGTPYLAGSGIKGVVRAACKVLWEEQRHTEAASLLSHYFGSEDESGGLVFFDLWPDVEEWSNVFRLDLVNPHYGPYYAKRDNKDNARDVPADWHSPIPSYFLTLRADLSWRLRILYSGATPSDRRASWADDIAPGLTRALSVEGLGAKRSWGYGLFAIEGALPSSRPWSDVIRKAPGPVQIPTGSARAPRLEPKTAPSPSGPRARPGLPAGAPSGPSQPLKPVLPPAQPKPPKLSKAAEKAKREQERVRRKYSGEEEPR